MRNYILFLLVITPFISFSQSKKDLISEAQYQAMRKEITLDSLKNLISSKKTALSALKQSNDKLSKQTDSLQILVSEKKAEVNLLRKNNEQTDLAYNSEIKRIAGFRTNLDELSAYAKLMNESRMFVSETNKTEVFQKAWAYFEEQIELLVSKAIEEDAKQAKSNLYSFYFDQRFENAAYLYKALPYASAGKQEAECLKEICSSISDEVDKLVSDDAWSGTIDAKRNEYLSYSRRLEAGYPKDASFMNVFHLYDLVNVLEGLQQYDLALSYSNLLLKSCPSKDIQYYHYNQRCDLHIELNKMEKALSDIELAINAYKIEKRDPTMLYLRELKKSRILIALGRYNDALVLCEKMLSGLTSTESTRKFMSNKKAWMLSNKLVCLYELGKIKQADDLFDYLSEYYLCDELIFTCGEQVFEPCIYHETYY